MGGTAAALRNFDLRLRQQISQNQKRSNHLRKVHQ